MNEKFQELGIGKYEKNMDNIFETLMNGGRTGEVFAGGTEKMFYVIIHTEEEL